MKDTCNVHVYYIAGYLQRSRPVVSKYKSFDHRKILPWDPIIPQLFVHIEKLELYVRLLFVRAVMRLEVV